MLVFCKISMEKLPSRSSFPAITYYLSRCIYVLALIYRFAILSSLFFTYSIRCHIAKMLPTVLKLVDLVINSSLIKEKTRMFKNQLLHYYHVLRGSIKNKEASHGLVNTQNQKSVRPLFLPTDENQPLEDFVLGY